MLTDQQIQNLEKVKKEFPQFDKILCDAIETWKQPNVFPIVNRWGVEFNTKTRTVEFCKSEKQECCLLGASLLNSKIEIDIDLKQINNEMIFIFHQKYNLTVDDWISIYRGFDDLSRFNMCNKCYNFGLMVRDALWF